MDAATRSLKATKLVEGNQYHFRVKAENDVGESDPAQTAEPVTAKLPFGAFLWTAIFFPVQLRTSEIARLRTAAGSCSALGERCGVFMQIRLDHRSIFRPWTSARTRRP